jgi:hypothetical protein
MSISQPSKINKHTCEDFTPEVLSPAWFRDADAVAAFIKALEKEERDPKATDHAVNKPPYRGYKFHYAESKMCSVVNTTETRWGAKDRILSNTRLINTHAHRPQDVCKTCWGELSAGPYEPPKRWSAEEKAKLRGLGGIGLHNTRAMGHRGPANDERN